MRGNKGIVLFIVLGTIVVVMVLANIVLHIVNSQSRLTHHQVSRIQSYYAAQAGANYAREMLRLNNAAWTPATGTATGCLARTTADCGSIAPCVIEPNLPGRIARVVITIGAPGSGFIGTRLITSRVVYTQDI